MTWPSLSNTFSANTKARSGEVNANFSDLKDAIGKYLLVTNNDYTVTDTDEVRVLQLSTAGSNRTVTLPTASANDRRIITIMKVDANTGNVIIDGEGAETINGYATINLTDQYQSITLQCNGSTWYKIGGKFSATVALSFSAETQKDITTSIYGINSRKCLHRHYDSTSFEDKFLDVSAPTTTTLRFDAVNTHTASYIAMIMGIE